MRSSVPRYAIRPVWQAAQVKPSSSTGRPLVGSTALIRASPTGSASGLRYSEECSWVTVAGSRSAIRGIFGPWYGPVATTTWSAVSVPAVVASSNAPDTARRSRVTRTPSASGGRTNAAYSSMYRMISARFMNPSGSGPR